MNPLKLLDKYYPQYKDLDIIDSIGYGTDGVVFSTLNNKVIKISLLEENDSRFEEIKSNIIYLTNNPKPNFVKVYDFKLLYSNELYIYYYVMDKLNNITDDESKVLRTLISHEDRSLKKDYDLSKIQSIISGLSMGLDFDSEKVIDFCLTTKNSNVIQNDIHERNVMKDEFGNFKFIDLERIMIKNE